MRRTLLALALLAQASALSPAPAAALQAYGPYGRYGGGAQARIWVDDEPDYFRRGDRMHVRFSVSDDAYVAILHVDTDGNLDFLFPRSPLDDQLLRGGRVYDLPRAGGYLGWTVRGRPGIGYLYMIASPVPLDYGAFLGRGSGTWDWAYAGRGVHGDPFWAMEQVTRLLLPGWGHTPYAVDYYTYHVDGRHRYPAYACSDRSLGYGWGWGYGYGPCDRLDYFLRDHPYYYDTRLYRGDRRGYLRDYGPADPRHRFKEDLRDPRAEPPRRRSALPEERGEELRQERPAPRQEAAEPAPRPERARPSLERRPAPERRAPAQGRTATPEARGRTSGAVGTSRGSAPPAGESGQRAPGRRAAERGGS